MARLNIPKIYSDPVLSRRRDGSPLEPFEQMEESLMVFKGRVLLTEIPNEFEKVYVTGRNVTLYESTDELLTEETYRVDYVSGIIYFDGVHEGKTFDFKYLGEGVHLFPDSRVYLTEDKNFINARDKFVDIDRAILVERNRITEQIVSHPQPSEVVDIRVDYNGKVFPISKDRIDAEQRKIEEAYVDANGVIFNSLKERIDSLQKSSEEFEDEQGITNGKIWAEISLVPGKIFLETGKLEEKMNGEVTRLTSRIDLIPTEINLRVEELRKDVDGKFTTSYSEINMLKDNLELKVDVDGVTSAINLSKEGVRISGKKLHLDGETHIDNAVIKSAHIDSISASKIRTGVLRSQNDNLTWNLNTGNLTMQNANFSLGGGADIEFEDPSNRLFYQRFDPVGRIYRSAGFGVGRSINDRFPYAFLGTTNTTRPSPMDNQNFTGFIANTRQRQLTDGIGNSVVGDVFHVRDKAVSYSQGFRFDLSNSTKVFYPINTGRYTYDIGRPNNRFRNVYTDNVRSNSSVNIRDSHRSSGWMAQTRYSGDGSAITLRGMNGGKFNYSLGARANYNRITTIFLKNRPNVSSDISLKEDIEEIDLGLDFVNDVMAVDYRLKPSFSNEKVNKKQIGVIAQQLKEVMQKHNVDLDDSTLLSQDEEGIYAVEYEQFIPIVMKAIQELSNKVDELSMSK